MMKLVHLHLAGKIENHKISLLFESNTNTRHHSNRICTARLPTVSCGVPGPSFFWGGWGNHPPPEVPLGWVGTHPLDIPTPWKRPGTRYAHPLPERTWDQRYPLLHGHTPVKTLPSCNFVFGR